MQTYINDILNANNQYSFIAGTKIRELPINPKIQNHGIIYPDEDRVLRLVEQTTDTDTLTKRTKNNVLKLTELYGIKWIYILKYSVIKERPGNKQRYAWIIYGIWNNKQVTFFRKETTNQCAGTTNLYFDNGYRIQISKLINPNESFQHILIKDISSKEKQHWIFVHQFRKLYKYIKSDELERFIIMHN